MAALCEGRSDVSSGTAPPSAPPVSPIVTASAMNCGPDGIPRGCGRPGCEECSTNVVNGSLPEEIIGYLFKPISIAFMHAAPSAKVPELAADLRRLGAYVAIIVVESGERLNQQLSTCELRQAMTAEPTAKELYMGV